MAEPEKNLAEPAAETPTQAGDEEIDLSAPIAKPESRFQRLLRTALRWLIVGLIVFILGVLAAVWFLFLPQNRELKQIRSDLSQANQQIENLESELSRLQPVKDQNETLQAELNKSNLRATILSVLSDVNAASLSLADNKPGEARSLLTKTKLTLQEISLSSGAHQQEVITAMQNRLQLVLDEMDSDSFAARSDLRVIATNLKQLEEQVASAP